MSISKKDVIMDIVNNRLERCLISKKDVNNVMGYFEFIAYENKRMENIQDFYHYIKHLKPSFADSILLFTTIHNIVIKDFGIESKGWIDQNYLTELMIACDIKKDVENFITNKDWEEFENSAEKLFSVPEHWYLELKYRITSLAWYGIPYRDISRIVADDVEIINGKAYIKNKTNSIKKYGDFVITYEPLVNFLYMFKTNTLPKYFPTEREKIFDLKNGALRKEYLEKFKDYPEIMKVGNIKLANIFLSGSMYRHYIGNEDEKLKEELQHKKGGNIQKIVYLNTIERILYKN